MSVADRPRKKLIKIGPTGLSNAELIAVILRAGTRSSPLANICNTIIEKISDNISNLEAIAIGQLAKIAGVGEVD
jgi:DNA repair protein RadC